MIQAKHTPDGDPSFRASLLQHLGGALLLVGLVAALFGAMGMIGRADDPLVIAGDEPASRDTDADDDAPGDEPPIDTPDDDAAPGEDEVTDGPAPDPADEGANGAEAPDDDGAGEDVADEDEPEPPVDEPGSDEPEPDPEPDDQPPAIDRASVSVQVLDGYQADGGAAADAVAQELADAGYRIIAQNPAIAYDVTTVLWTTGNEAAARQVAQDLGATEVREQPGNLSDSVAVHVVVGADRG